MKTLTFLTLLLCGQLLLAQSFTQAPSSIPLPFFGFDRSSVLFFDMDGDGDEDLIMAGRNKIAPYGQITKLYTNVGNGRFDEVIGTPIVGIQEGTIAAADIDGDADQDLLVSGLNNDSEVVTKLYTNNGTGTFTEVLNTPFPNIRWGSIAFADLDNDNDQDLLICGRGDSSLANVVTHYYTNDGAGNFSRVVNDPFVDVWNGSIAVSDIDGDLDLDILISGVRNPRNPVETVSSLYTNDGLGNFTLVSNTPFIGVACLTGGNAFLDVDGDNDQDILITGLVSGLPSSSVARLYLNDGQGNYTTGPNPPFNSSLGVNLSIADVDGDSDQDIFITGLFDNQVQTRKSSLFLNDGVGNFSESTQSTFIGAVSGFSAFSDVDGDGDPDLLLTGNADLNAPTPSGNLVTRLYINGDLLSAADDAQASFQQALTLYPNPTADGRFQIDFESLNREPVAIRIYDLTGRLLQASQTPAKLGNQTLSVDVQDLSSGSYWLKLSQGGRQVARQIVVE